MADDVEELIGDDDDPLDSYDEDMQDGVNEEGDPANDYVLLETLDGEEGSGSMVIKGQFKEDPSVFVAIKVLEFGDNAEQAFVTLNPELTHLIQLGAKNAHVLRCHTAHVQDTALWLVNEYCEGCSALDEAIVLRTLREAEIAAMVFGIVKALISLNELKLVHGNLRASNALIAADGSVKLADFGQLGQLKGATDWQSPEALTDKSRITDKSDVWSLGIVCFELTEYVTPFQGATSEEVEANIREGPIPTLSTKRKWSQNFQDFVSKCLDRDVARRPSPLQLLQHPFLKSVGTLDAMRKALVPLVVKFLEKREAINEWARSQSDQSGQKISSLSLAQYKTLFFTELIDAPEEEPEGDEGDEGEEGKTGDVDEDLLGSEESPPRGLSGSDGTLNASGGSGGGGAEEVCIQDLDRKDIVKQMGSIQGRNLVLQYLESCNVQILDWTGEVSILNCTECNFTIGPSAGALSADGLDGCTISAAAPKVHCVQCDQTTLFLWTPTPPVMERCTGMLIGPWSVAMPNLRALFQKAGLDTAAQPNRFDAVEDRSKGDKTIPTPHWTLIRREEVEKQIVGKNFGAPEEIDATTTTTTITPVAGKPPKEEPPKQPTTSTSSSSSPPPPGSAAAAAVKRKIARSVADDFDASDDDDDDNAAEKEEEKPRSSSSPSASPNAKGGGAANKDYDDDFDEFDEDLPDGSNQPSPQKVVGKPSPAKKAQKNDFDDDEFGESDEPPPPPPPPTKAAEAKKKGFSTPTAAAKAVKKAGDEFDFDDDEDAENEVGVDDLPGAKLSAAASPAGKSDKSSVSRNTDEDEVEDEFEDPSPTKSSPQKPSAVTVAGKRGEQVALEAGSVAGKPLHLNELSKCVVHVFDVASEINVSHCEECTIVLAPTSGVVCISESSNCTIAAAANQIQLTECENLRLNAFSVEPICCFASNGVAVGPWNIAFAGLTSLFTTAKLSAAMPPSRQQWETDKTVLEDWKGNLEQDSASKVSVATTAGKAEGVQRLSRGGTKEVGGKDDDEMPPFLRAVFNHHCQQQKPAPAAGAASAPAPAPAVATAAPIATDGPQTLPSDEKMTYVRKLDGRTIVRPPGSLNKQQFAMDSLTNCKVKLFSIMDSVLIDDCYDCDILIGPTTGSVMLRDCARIRLTAACQQLRTRNCEAVGLNLYCFTDPVVETSHHVTFDTFNAAYAGLTAQFTEAGLDPAHNRYRNVFDFNKNDPAVPEPHFLVLGEGLTPSIREYEVTGFQDRPLAALAGRPADLPDVLRQMASGEIAAPTGVVQDDGMSSFTIGKVSQEEAQRLAEEAEAKREEESRKKASPIPQQGPGHTVPKAMYDDAIELSDGEEVEEELNDEEQQQPSDGEEEEEKAKAAPVVAPTTTAATPTAPTAATSAISALIFLDIDGVLVPVSPMEMGGGDIDDGCLSHLKEIVTAMATTESSDQNVRIILTSTWRMPNNKDKLERLNAALKGVGLAPVLAGTPAKASRPTPITSLSYLKDDPTEQKLVCDRVDEILEWLATNSTQFPQPPKWIAIDDMNLGEDPRMAGHFVLTDISYGLCKSDVQAAKQLLQALAAPTAAAIASATEEVEEEEEDVALPIPTFTFGAAPADDDDEEEEEKNDFDDDSDEDETEETNADLLKKPTGAATSGAAVRRNTVSAEVYNAMEVSETWHAPVVPKAKEDTAWIEKTLHGHTLFKQLDDREIGACAGAMAPVVFKKGAVVFTQGDPVDENSKFYLIADGSCSVTSKARPAARNLTKGNTFGDEELLYPQPRSATISVVSESGLQAWALDRMTYTRLMHGTFIKKRALYSEFLSKISFLQTLTQPQLIQLADALQPENFKRGEYLIRYGEEGEWFYIIVEGEVEVLGRDPKNPNQTIPVCEFKRGDCVGEMEFLNAHKTVADVRAKSAEVRTAKLNRPHFEMCMGPVKDLLRESREVDPVFTYYRRTRSMTEQQQQQQPNKPTTDGAAIEIPFVEGEDVHSEDSGEEEEDEFGMPSSTGVKAVRATDIVNLSHQTVRVVPGTLNGADLLIGGLSDCTIEVFDWTKNVSLVQCRNSRILLGPSAATVSVSDCAHCKLTTACQTIKLSDCTDLSLKLFAMTDPILQSCSKIAINTWNVAFPRALSLFAQSKLDLARNRFRCVCDKSERDVRVPNPHYFIEDLAAANIVKIDLKDNNGKVIDNEHHEMPEPLRACLLGESTGGDEAYIRIGPLKFSPSGSRGRTEEGGGGSPSALSAVAAAAASSAAPSPSPQTKPPVVAATTKPSSEVSSSPPQPTVTSATYIPRGAMASPAYRQCLDECSRLKAKLTVLRELYTTKAAAVDHLLQNLLAVSPTPSPPPPSDSQQQH